MKKIFGFSLLLIITLCLSSCSWGILLFVGNNFDQEIQVTYKINETNFLKSPKTFAFDKNIYGLYYKNEKKRPSELPNNAEYDEELKTVTLTIKPSEAVFIGGYASFESFEQELDKSELKIIINKDSVIEKNKLIELSKYKRKTRLIEIK
ncbi:hypothetical protein HNV10_16575 [Winogradskyella litoriviva]|uniref:Lipoprotein n=1 Tax=Winogradskyella litoriviva TaxID=1220182 RepID=A0ABX2E999_9FLAO|nr:hypothetical protein [Winogradskyella litoriviva]NRD24871.1 hypothetical protein [Winogradskyella litoriviva]